MIKTAVTICAVSLLVFAGCSTTPKSIQTLGGLEIQFWEAMERDVEDIVTTYDKELHHWVDNAFKFIVRDVEMKLITAEGDIELDQYKAQLQNIAQQKAQVYAQYELDKESTLDAVKDKINQAKHVQLLINEYESSVGVSPETLQSLFDEVHGSYQIIQAARETREADTSPPVDDIHNQLDLMLDGFYSDAIDAFRAQIEARGISIPDVTPVTEGE
jgi:TolA-binding protein